MHFLFSFSGLWAPLPYLSPHPHVCGEWRCEWGDQWGWFHPEDWAPLCPGCGCPTPSQKGLLYFRFPAIEYHKYSFNALLMTFNIVLRTIHFRTRHDCFLFTECISVNFCKGSFIFYFQCLCFMPVAFIIQVLLFTDCRCRLCLLHPEKHAEPKGEDSAHWVPQWDLLQQGCRPRDMLLFGM